jgi:hypothetical protein
MLDAFIIDEIIRKEREDRRPRPVAPNPSDMPPRRPDIKPPPYIPKDDSDITPTDISPPPVGDAYII